MCEMNIEENKEDVFSIAVFSVTSVKVAVRSNVLCDALIYTALSFLLHMCTGGVGTLFFLFFFSSLSDLKVGMCGKGLMCKK